MIVSIKSSEKFKFTLGFWLKKTDLNDLNLSRGESFQDYSCFQDFEADFRGWKSASKDS